MKKLIALCLVFAFVLPAFAVDDAQVVYVGGTVTGLKESTMGKLDTTQADAIIFEHAGGKFTIPYARITSYQYSEKLAYHSGVLATLAVVLVKYRRRRHFYSISYKDDSGQPQVAIFEVSKETPLTLSAVLNIRVPRPCRPYSTVQCKSIMPMAPAGNVEANMVLETAPIR